MRALQLAGGWIVICGLTAAGSYFGAIELDQDFGLRAKICPQCSAAPNASAGTSPAPPDPVTKPGGSGPIITPPDPVPSTRPQPGNSSPAPVSPPPQRSPVPTPQPQPQLPPPQVNNPPAGKTVSPALVSRYNSDVERGRDIINFYTQMDSQLRGQGLSIKSEFTIAIGSTRNSLSGAADSMRRGDESTAARQLDAAEKTIVFLEQSR